MFGFSVPYKSFTSCGDWKRYIWEIKQSYWNIRFVIHFEIGNREQYDLFNQTL